MSRTTAASLAEDLAAGTVTSVEATQKHLDRIAEVDGRVHAFLHVDADGALEQAAAPTHVARAARRSRRWTACRSRSRT